MKNLQLILIVLLFVSCSSSTDSDPDENEKLFVAEVEVVSTSSWSEESPEYRSVSGADVHVYHEKDSEIERTIITNSDGSTTITEDREDEVCITVEKDGESNIVNDYIVNGVFESSNDIAASPAQDNAEVGEVKFFDLNADGVIDEKDQTTCQPVELYLTNEAPLTIYIAHT